MLTLIRSSTNPTDTAANLSEADLSSLLDLAQRPASPPAPHAAVANKFAVAKEVVPPAEPKARVNARIGSTVIRKILTKGR